VGTLGWDTRPPAEKRRLDDQAIAHKRWLALELHVVLSEGGNQTQSCQKLSIVTYIRLLASGIGDGPFAR
jgi:hypothetical protein